MSDFRVRPTTRADTAAVDDILKRSFRRLLKADYPPSVQVTAIPLIARAKPELLGCGTYFLVEDVEGQPVGCGGWTAHGPRGEGAAHVRHVATDPDHVRRGVGRALMAHVFATCRQAGIARLHCLSTLTAERFYAGLGFERIGVRDIELRPGVHFASVSMIRDASRS